MRVVEIIVPPDKSISHRAIMLASISEGTTCIRNLLLGDDCLSTIKAFRAMGVRIVVSATKREKRKKSFMAGDAIVKGVGLRGLKKPKGALYLGNSGTTMRILSGILAGQNFQVVLKGDGSLSKRPMLRIARPLRQMGADISGLRHRTLKVLHKEIYPPLKIKGARLKAIRFKSMIASAQVKSCILMAGLFAEGVTGVIEPVKSRDHTERMLRQFGVRCEVQGFRSQVTGITRLKSLQKIRIPGDISSAAFFIVAGCILPSTKLIIKNVGLNPTRTGVLDILKKMDASIQIIPRRSLSRAMKDEPYGDIVVESSDLNGVRVSPKEVVSAIDEIPIIMIASCIAKGITLIQGIGELRVKETDRIKSMVTNLRKLGADIEVEGERLRIKGSMSLHGGRVSSYGDHRTAMSMLVAGLITKGEVNVTGLGCINKSFPGFESLLRKLI